MTGNFSFFPEAPTSRTCAHKALICMAGSCANACSDNLWNYSSSVCGDGVVDEAEECDDGNEIDGEGCDVTCRLTS